MRTALLILAMIVFACGEEDTDSSECTTPAKTACQQQYNSCLDQCSSSDCACRCADQLYRCYDNLGCDRNAGQPCN